MREIVISRGGIKLGIGKIKMHSGVLNKVMNISVYVPESYDEVNLPVLYFLHGRSGNEEILEQLKINEVVSKLIKEKKIKPIIIVCPNMENSRGINSSNEYKEIQGKYGIVNLGLYEDYLINEVIPYIDKNYKTISNKENRYIGGISSGGYIALHNGLRHQDLFSKIGGHMPAIDLSYSDEDECYFENEEMWNKYDPITIAKNHDVKNIKIYLDDGNEDEGKFYLSCEKLYSVLKEKSVDVEYNLFKGHHNAEYILSNIENYLKFYNS